MRSNKAKLYGMNLFKCSHCSSELQYCGTISYCSQCRQTQNVFDNTVNEANFQQNGRLERKSKEICNLKIQTYAKDILCKINVRLSQSEVNAIAGKVRQLHLSRGHNCKGYREEAAIVIFKDHQDEIRMTLHQYCKKAKIDRKKLNKMLLAYQRISKRNDNNKSRELKIQENVYDQQSERLKREESNESHDSNENKVNEFKISSEHSFLFSPQQQDKYDRKIDFQCNIQREAYEISQRQLQQERMTIRKTISELYCQIFPSEYMKKFKAEVINRVTTLSLAISQVYQQSQPINCMKKYFRVPSIIFSVMKMLKCKIITMKEYIQKVYEILNVKITQRMIGKFSLLCKNCLLKQENQDDEQDERFSSTKSQVEG